MTGIYGMGTVEELIKGKKYRIQLPCGKDPVTGKYLRVRETFIGTKRQAELRIEEEKRARREGIYGSDTKGGYIHKQINYYIFKDQDLDNDNLISSVVSVPTYKRKKSQLEQLENISNGITTNTVEA